MRVINLAIKRIFDLVISGLAIVVLVPLWIVVSILIKIDSEGPIFFIQKRRTKDGRVFNMYKFRSMKVNSELSGTKLFSYAGDPRVTRVGKFLRETSIDELPQLFNIFLGDMSIVGPRPPVEWELGDFETLNRSFRKRFQMRGGLTGLAQVKGRNNIRWDEKVTYDNQYIDAFEKYGAIYDMLIIFWTIQSVFKKKSIYESKLDDNMDDMESAMKAEAEILRLAHLEDYNNEI